MVDESLRVVSGRLVGELVTSVLPKDESGCKEETVALGDAENVLESVVDFTKGVVSRRDDEPVDD